MAPKKKIVDKPPKATVKRAQKPMKPSPKTVEVKIGSSVALALLQAESSRISPKLAKTLAKQTNSQNTVKKPVKKRTPVTKKSIKNYSIDDSVTPQEQLHTPVTKKHVNNTTEKHSVDDSMPPQEQLHSPVRRKYVKKTINNHSVDNSVTPQEQLHTPVIKKYVKKTTKNHSVDDSVTPQKQLHTPVRRKYVKKITKNHSVDDSVTPKEQLNTPVRKKYVKKISNNHSVDDSVTPQEQLHTPVRKKYVKKTKKNHSVGDSVTPQRQLRTPVTKKYVNKTTEEHSVYDSVAPQKQVHSPVTSEYVSNTTENHSVDEVTQQEQLLTPVTINYDSKTTDTKVYSVDDSGTEQIEKKKRPAPKSRTLLKVMKKPATCITKAKIKPSRKKLQKSVKSANISQENSKGLSSDIPSKQGLAGSEGCENLAVTPIKRLRGRPEGSTLAKSKILDITENKIAVVMLEKVLKNPSPPQPKNRPNSVISNKSNLTWTKDISTESSISSDTTTSVTVTSNDSEQLNYKVEQLEYPDQLKVKNDNLKQIDLSEISRNETSSSDSNSSSSSSSSSDSELVGANTLPELNLSTSSLTPKSPLSDANTDLFRQKIENIHKLVKDFKADNSTLWPHHDDYLYTNSDALRGMDPDIDDIINNCDNFDSDIEARFQLENNTEKSVERHRTADFTEPKESEIRSLKDSRRLSYEDNRETISPERYRLRQKSVYDDSETNIVKPCLVKRVSAANSQDISTYLPDEQLVSNTNRIEASPADSFKTFTSDDYNYVPFDRTQDDEDALSLYAESIGGMESSRLDSVASVSNVSLQDVYVPKYSPTSCMRQKYVYRPTKIQVHRNNLAEESIEEGENISNKGDHDQEKGPDTRIREISQACVSSSGSRAMNKPALELQEDSNRTSLIDEESIKRSEAQMLRQHCRSITTYQQMNPIRSSLYRGFCFFFMATQCKKAICRFPHIIIGENTFKHRLSLLSQENLIAEYLLMRGYGSLKRRYCILFVEECIRRTATRILLEMAIDIGLGFVEIDEDLRVKALETTLLHLNTISLDECDDLLKFEHNDTMLCDALLSCMANSQNFAQFKRAFVKLANLMSELNRPVDFQVASSILERVCILPGEDFLARGMLTLMENTDVSIFNSSLACSFEVQLSKIDSDIHAMYLLAKNVALEGRLAQPDVMLPETDLLMPRGAQNGPQQTSPDSTNMDNLPELLPPVTSAPRRFVEPTLPLWRRGGYITKRHRPRRS